MTLTPQNIVDQSFSLKFKGYDADEVDSFLDRVADQLNELLRNRDELTERLRRAESDPSSGQSESLLSRTLLVAQRSADDTIADAERRAASLVEEAERESSRALEEARQHAEEVRAEADRTAAEILEDARREAGYARETAREELARVQHAVAELQRFRAEYRDRVRGVIAEHLDLLDRAGDVPDLPAGIEQLAHVGETVGNEA